MLIQRLLPEEKPNGQCFSYTYFEEHFSISWKLLEGFTEIENLGKYLRSTFFYPSIDKIPLVQKTGKLRSVNKQWVDGYGHLLEFSRKSLPGAVYQTVIDFHRYNYKQVKLFKNPDPYCGLSIHQQVKIGDRFYYMTGLDEDTLQRQIVLVIFGVDGKTRSFVFTGKWVPFSAWEFGFDFVKNFVDGTMDNAIAHSFTPCRKKEFDVTSDRNLITEMVRHAHD